MRTTHSMIRKNMQQSFCHHIRSAGVVIKLGNILMKALVESKQLEEVGWGRVGGCTGFTLTEGGCKVVAFSQDGTLMNIQTLCCTVQVEQAAGKFKVQI